MPAHSAATHHIKDEQNANMLLFWLECAKFTINTHYVVQGSHVTELLFKQWINIDVNYKLIWLK